MKKIMALAAALTLIFTTAACSKASSEERSSVENVKITQTMYKEEYAELPDDIREVYNMGYVEGKGVCIIYIDRAQTVKAAFYDDDMKIAEVRELYSGEDIFHTRACIGDDGSLYTFNITVKSDKELGEEGYFDNAETAFYIRGFSSDGTELFKTEISEMGRYYTAGEDHLESFDRVNGKFIITTPNMMITADESGEILNAQEKKENFCYCEDSEGRLIGASYKGFAYIDDIAPLYDEDMAEYGEYITLAHGCSKGHDGFRALFMLSDGVYGLDDDNSLVKLLDYQSSLMSSGEYYMVTYAGKGKFAAYGYDVQSRKGRLSVMTVRPDDYVMDRKEVVFGLVGYNEELFSMYNGKSDSYKISTKKYSSTDDFQKDVLTGDPPDGFCYSNASNMIKLSNIGAFCDLYELSGKYGGFKKEDILENVSEALERDGKLYGIAQKFSFNAHIGTKKMFPKNNMTWEEFKAIYDSTSEDVFISTYTGMRRTEDVFNFLCLNDINEYIDYEKAECRFDTPEFAEKLEFAKNARRTPEIDWEEFYKTHTSEENDAFHRESKAMIKNGKAMLEGKYIFSLLDYNYLKSEYSLKSDEIAFVSSPSDKPTVSISFDSLYSVTANGSCPEGAWDFINYIMSDELLTSYLQTEDFFVSRKESFEKILKSEQYKSKNPKVLEADGTITHYGIGAAGPVTDEELDGLREYISRCTVLNDCDESIKEILWEEFGAFDAGERTAEEAAKLMQNRVSIYLSENYG